MFEIKVNNLDQVLDRMKDFTAQVQKRVTTTAARNAMRPVAALAKSNLRAQISKTEDSQSTGALLNAIVVRNNPRQGKRQGGVVMQVGIEGGAKQYVDSSRNRARVIKRGKRKGIFIPGRVGESYEQGGNQFYFRFLEFGTSKMAARPFLRPALAKNTQRTNQIFVDEMNKGIDRALRRMKK